MEKFDVIVIGAGPAGSTAGTMLARAGLNVVIIERGQAPGQKNVSGGLLYSRPIAEIFPEFWKSAPVERAITGHQLAMLSDDSSVALDFCGHKSAEPPYNAFSVLRARLDPWLAAQAEEAGANLITGVTVDNLLIENGKVIGIEAGSDQLGADIVIDAEGTRSLLLKKAGLREDYHPHDVSVGVKEIIALPEKTIEERFHCDSGTGTAYTILGSTAGIQGGGFLYTNKDTISLGLVVKMDSLYESKKHPHEVLDIFKKHPFIANLIKDGETVEYSAQTVHRGGYHLMSKLYGNGYMVAGSAARLLLNNILTLRGMDYAIISAVAAAKAAISAFEKKDFSMASLSAYEQELQKTSIYKDWKTFKDTYPLLENQRLFDVYPELITNIMEDLFSASDVQNRKALPIALGEMKGKIGMVTIAKDLLQIARGLVL